MYDCSALHSLWEHWDTHVVSWHWKDKTNGCHFVDNIFKYIFLTKNVYNLLETLLKFIAKNPTDIELALVQVMASDWTDDI